MAATGDPIENRKIGTGRGGTDTTGRTQTDRLMGTALYVILVKVATFTEITYSAVPMSLSVWVLPVVSVPPVPVPIFLFSIGSLVAASVEISLS